MKILFISHDATRTGAPFVLLHFCRWIKQHLKNDNIQFDIFFLASGPLVKEFENIADKVYVRDNKNTNLFKKIIKKVSPFLSELFFPVYPFSKNDQKKYSLIFSNSIASVDVALELKKKLMLPIIVHLHELYFTIKYFNDNLAEKQEQIKKFICVSNAVTQNIVQKFGVPIKKTVTIYPFINFEDLKIKISEDNLIKKKNEFVICGSGTLNWRKNPDTFFQVASIVRKMLPTVNLKFIWVGADDNEILKKYLEDINKMEGNSYIEVIQKTSNPFQYYNISDLFIMTSREDPFPLVCIEAGYLGKPIICFENAGGIPEMLANGGGKVVPYLDNCAMANAIVAYYMDRNLLERDGSIIKRKVNDYDVLKIAPMILDTMLEEMSNEISR